MTSDPLSILRQLISIPSVNPMGRDVSGDEFFEGRVTAWLAEYLRSQGMPCEIIETASGRCNVLTRVESNGGTGTVLLDAHQDTVPVDGMTIPPFTPTERDGRMYGRGSCDVKGGLAAMLSATTRLYHERPQGMPNVVMSMTCDEESTSLGINHLVDSWKNRTGSYQLCPQAPDVAIVAEPTELDIVVAHRGATRWKIRTAGRACHSSRPSEGTNAIYRMAKVLGLLEEYAAWLPDSRPAHRLCGPATLSVGLISGGSSVNVVPDACVIDVDRRVLPGEDSMTVRSEVIEFLRSRLDFELTHDAPYCLSAALGDELNGALAEDLRSSIHSVVGTRQILGVPYGTHASRTAAIGIPSVVFGPGNIAQAHTKDEWIETRQVIDAAEIYFQFCCQKSLRAT
ncbi:MAG: M20 family metallopeptidase [Planctomyces sp.]|nr:M20 family metallopeptidase [Planctomyces sp.]